MLYGGTLLAVNLGGAGRALTYHEVVFAQPAREMLETGDWIIPRMLGIPDTHKPPLTSWLIALAIQCLGAGEWAVRVPSVLAALAAAVWLGFLAARWFGDHIGCLTGLIHLTMYHVLQFGRLAESDVFLVLFVALALGIFALANIDSPFGRRRQRWLPWAFYLACGLAFMTKSLIGLAFIGSAGGLFAIWQRDWRVWRFLLDPIGLLVLVVCLLAWPLAAYLAYPPFLDDQLRHHFGRFHGYWGEDEPVYCYLYNIPKCGLPWSPLAVWGIVVGWRQGWARGPLGRFALCWVVPGTILLTMSQWRHYHYVAPLMPPFAVLSAVGLWDFVERRHASARPWWRLPLVMNLGLAAGVVLVMSLANVRGRGPILGVIAVAAVACWWIGWLEQRRRMRAQLAALFGLVWLLAAGTFQFVIPHYDLYSQLAGFAERVNRIRPAHVPVHMVDLKEDQLTWYLERPLVRVDEPQKLDTTRDMYLLAPREVIEALEQTGRLQIIERSPVAPRRLESLRVFYARWQPDLQAVPVSLRTP
ncbi:MAG: glycosyltransferase family 39 protein [Gemmataceae bacterium]|nr:glycosyltransferase family 39 protein [Gemmataceae bacterium]